MPDTTYMNVANILFETVCELPIVPRAVSEAYGPFLDAGGDCETHVKVCVVPTSEAPAVSERDKVFDAGNWTMFRTNGSRTFVWDTERPDGPLWTAELQTDFSRVRIHPGRCLLEEKDGRTVVRNPMSYPLDQILTMYVLSLHEGMLVHGAGWVRDGCGYLFPGRSGAGKSTLSRILLEGASGRILSDDRLAVRRSGNGFAIFGTPWTGETRIARNEGAPLSGMLFLSHGRENRVAALSQTEALKRLFPTVSIPWYDPDILPGMLDFCGRLVSQAPVYELQFTPDGRAAELLEEFSSNGCAPTAGGSVSR